MLTKILFLVTIAVIAVQGEVSEERIQADAARWTELHEQYMKATPYRCFRGLFKTQCNVMLECCPEERDNFFNLMHEHTFEDVCYGDSDASAQTTKCTRYIRELNSIKASGDYKSFVSAHSGITGHNERFRAWRARMSRVCSAEELEAYYCEPENMALFQSCQEKILRSVAEENKGRNYEAYVRQFKSHYNTYLQRLRETFSNLSL